MKRAFGLSTVSRKLFGFGHRGEVPNHNERERIGTIDDSGE